MQILPYDTLIAALTYLTASGPWYSAYVGLFQSFTNNGQNTTFGDFVEATFSGYARVQISSWGTPVQVATNLVRAQHPSVVFTAAGIGTTNQIYGYFILKSDGSTLLTWEENGVSGGVPMTVDGATYTVTPRLESAEMV